MKFPSLRSFIPPILARGIFAPQPQATRTGAGDFTPAFWGNRRMDPAQVRNVLQNAAAGSLADQWELFSLMEDTWPRLMKNLGEVRRAAARTTFAVQPYATGGEEPTEQAKAKADTVEAALKNWRPRPGTLELGFEDALANSLDAYGKGVSVLEVTWAQHADGILPRAAHLLAPGKYGWNHDGTELGLVHGVAGAGRGTWQPFPDGQFWCGIWQARSGAPGATAMLRALAPYWVGITFGWEWLLATAQIFGVPFRWATYDRNSPELLGTITQMLEQMGQAGYAAFPEGTTLEFKEAAARASENPQVLIQTLADKACDLLILGQELSGGAQKAGLGGGAADLQGSVRREVLHGAAQWCADLLSYQLVPAVLRFNWGDESEAPKVVPDLAGEPDPLQLAQRDEILLRNGVPLPRGWLYERHGVPEPEAGDETISGQGASPDRVVGGPAAPGGAKAPAGAAEIADENDDPEKSPQNEDSDSVKGKMAGGGGDPLEINPPRSAVPLNASSGARGSAETPVLPGAYQTPAGTKRRLAAARGADFEPIRAAAEPLLAAIEAGDLNVVGELEAFIAHLDGLAPAVIGASELADALEGALTEAAIAGAAGAYRKADKPTSTTP